MGWVAEIEPEVEAWLLGLAEKEFGRAQFLVAGRRIILLTVFRKTKARETREVDRAERAMRRCIDQGHTAEESDD